VIELLLQAERALAIGMVDQAERLYRQAIAADPRNSIAVVGLARVALEHSDDAEAYRRAQQALQIDPENVAANRLARRLEELHAHHRRMRAQSASAPATASSALDAPPAPASPPAPAPAARAVAAPDVAPVREPQPVVAPEPEPAATPEHEPAPAPKRVAAPEPRPQSRPWAVGEHEIEQARPTRRRSLLDWLLRRNRA